MLQRRQAELFAPGSRRPCRPPGHRDLARRPPPARPAAAGHRRRPRSPRAACPAPAAHRRKGAPRAATGRGDSRVRPPSGPGTQPPYQARGGAPRAHGRARPGRASRASSRTRRSRGRRVGDWTPSYVGFVLAKGRPVRAVDLGPAAPIDEAVRTVARGHRGAASESRRRDPPPPGLGAAGAALPARDDDRDSRSRWPLDRHPLGRAARRQARHRAPGAVRPGHRAPCPVPARSADRAGARRPDDTRHPPGRRRRGLRPGPKARRRREDQGRAAGRAPARDRPRPGRRLERAARHARRAERRDEARRLAHRGSPRGSRGRHRSAPPRAAPRPLGAHRHPRLLRRSERPLGPAARSQALFYRSAANVSAPACATRWSSQAWSWPAPIGPAPTSTASTRDDLGILTAEAIAGLPLQDLELVVLSACETGLGLVGGGEGVFGLQRAFHLAGAHNVVASLWQVDDQATAALMAIFYDQLWREHKPPIEALRTAQLRLYHHPECIGRARQAPRYARLRQAGPAPGARPHQRPASRDATCPDREMGRVRALGMGEVRTQMMNRCGDHRKGCDLALATVLAAVEIVVAVAVLTLLLAR